MDQGSEPAFTLFTLFVDVSSICRFLPQKPIGGIKHDSPGSQITDKYFNL
jgi:hypothetical protein